MTLKQVDHQQSSKFVMAKAVSAENFSVFCSHRISPARHTGRDRLCSALSLAVLVILHVIRNCDERRHDNRSKQKCSFR